MLQTNGSMIIFGGVNWLSSGLTLGSVFRKKSLLTGLCVSYTVWVLMILARSAPCKTSLLTLYNSPSM